MWSINGASTTFPWHKYIWEKMGLEYHLPEQMWTDDAALATVWNRSQWAQVYRGVLACMPLAAFYSAVEKYHIKATHSSSESHEVRRSEKCSVCVFSFFGARERFCCQNEMMQTCFARSFVPSVSVPHSVSVQADPECCESLFIKSIPAPWPRSSHANCCLLRPFSTFLFFFSFTCTPARACMQTCTKMHEATDNSVAVNQVWCDFWRPLLRQNFWIWFRVSWWRTHVLVMGTIELFRLILAWGGLSRRSGSRAFTISLLFHPLVVFSSSV